MAESNITHSDKEGNYFLVKQRSKNTLSVHLYLSKESKSRELGVVNEDKKVFTIRRDPNKHIFKKNQSYGFNEYVIKTAKKFDQIHLIEDGGDEYLFPKSLVMELGSYLHFKSEGFERQIFVTLKNLAPYKIQSPSL